MVNEEVNIYSCISYVIVYVISTIYLFPSTPLNLSAGSIFGFNLGFGLAYAGAVISSIVSFAIVRLLGKDYILQKLPTKWRSADKFIKARGFIYTVIVRLVPFFPYGVVNYTISFTSIKFSDFLMATLIGTAPGIAPYVFLGSISSDFAKVYFNFDLNLIVLISVLVILLSIAVKVWKT